MSSINPLKVQTSSATISLVLELLKSGLRNGAIIGIGNDIGLWSALLIYMNSLDIFESDPDWLQSCEQYAKNTCLAFGQSEKRVPTFHSFSNFEYKTAAQQAAYLSSQNAGQLSMIDDVISRHPLYNHLTNSKPDWIYVDGPLGGYWSETDFQNHNNTGRMETIMCSVGYLIKSNTNREKWLIVDDCHRFIEKKTLNLLSSFLIPSQGIPLGRNTLAFKVKSQDLQDE